MKTQKNAYRTVVVKTHGKCPLRKTKRRWKDKTIKMDVRELSSENWRTLNL
jgi:hypothetical protein